jgi:hypothetical protein
MSGRSAGRVRARPASLGVPREGRVHEKTPKRVDQGHVERGEAAHRLHVDGEVERVAAGSRRQREGQEGMHGRIAELAERFVTEDVEHSERTFASPWRHLGLRAVAFSKAMDVRRAGRIMALVVPSEGAAEGPSQREQSSNRDVGRWTPIAEQDRTSLPDAPTGPSAREWNRPDIVERHVAEKRVAAQVESSKLGRIDAHATVGSPSRRPSGPFLPDALLPERR